MNDIAQGVIRNEPQSETDSLATAETDILSPLGGLSPVEMLEAILRYGEDELYDYPLSDSDVSGSGDASFDFDDDVEHSGTLSTDFDPRDSN